MILSRNQKLLEDLGRLQVGIRVERRLNLPKEEVRQNPADTFDPFQSDKEFEGNHYLRRSGLNFQTQTYPV